jgi:hypothetical protein
MKRQTELKKEQFIKAYEFNGGNISLACKTVNISRDTYYRWMKSSRFKSDVDDALESVIDHVESKLIQLIEEGNLSAIIFFLKCKGKSRGWFEKQEIAHSGVIKIKGDFLKPEPASKDSTRQDVIEVLGEIDRIVKDEPILF